MAFFSAFHRRCYWLLLAMTINVPGFTPFDLTGRTHDFGLFNPQSLSRIAVTLSVAGIALLVLLLRRFPAAVSRVRREVLPLICLYSLFAVTSLPWKPKSVELSAYRIFEWALAITLAVYLFASSSSRPDRLTSKFVFRIAAAVVLIVAAVAPVSPSLAFASIDANTGFFEYRFGGSVFPPNTVGTMAGIAITYVLLLWRGWPRILGTVVFSAALVLTYSRGALGAFVVAFVAIQLLFGAAIPRLLTLLGGLFGVFAAGLFQDKVLHYLSRGTGPGSVTQASGRVAIWAAGWQMFLAHPWRGWGFISGVKDHFPDFYANTTFAPQHLHNDILQALVSGGIVAGAIVLLIFSTALWRAFRCGHLSIYQQFLFGAVVQLFLHSMEAPVLSADYQPVGACALICFVGVSLANRSRLAATTPAGAMQEMALAA